MDRPFLSQQYERTPKRRIFWELLLHPKTEVIKSRGYHKKYVRVDGKKSLIKIYLRKDDTGVFLSGTQAVCMMLMLSGVLDNVSLAKKLDLIETTIKWYKYQLKKKLCVKLEKDLINIVRKSSFLDNYNKIYPKVDK